MGVIEVTVCAQCMHIRRGICHCILDEEKICGRAAVAGGG